MNTQQERDIEMAPGFSRRTLNANEAMATASALAFIQVNPAKQEEVSLTFDLGNISQLAASIRDGNGKLALSQLSVNKRSQ